MSRVINSFIAGINARAKLPRVAVIILDKDFIEALQVERESVVISASLYGMWCEWLADKIDKNITKSEELLPEKARRPPGEPIIYWTAIPSHKLYSHDLRVEISKFNNCLESVIKVHKNMRLIKLKDGWNYEDTNLVTHYGRVTHQGFHQMWYATDSSVQFNLNKRAEYINRAFQNSEVSLNSNTAAELSQHHGESHFNQLQRDPMVSFFKKHARPKNKESSWSKSGYEREEYNRQGVKCPTFSYFLGFVLLFPTFR